MPFVSRLSYYLFLRVCVHVHVLVTIVEGVDMYFLHRSREKLC